MWRAGGRPGGLAVGPALWDGCRMRALAENHRQVWRSPGCASQVLPPCHPASSRRRTRGLRGSGKVGCHEAQRSLPEAARPWFPLQLGPQVLARSCFVIRDGLEQEQLGPASVLSLAVVLVREANITAMRGNGRHHPSGAWQMWMSPRGPRAVAFHFAPPPPTNS